MLSCVPLVLLLFSSYSGPAIASGVWEGLGQSAGAGQSRTMSPSVNIRRPAGWFGYNKWADAVMN